MPPAESRASATVAEGLAPGRRDWRRVVGIAIDLALVAVIVSGVAARVVELPHYVPDSGDEWGNTIAPLRVLLEHGNPGTFFHPSLYYYVTAAVYAALFGVLKVLGVVAAPVSITDLFVTDERYFVFAARGVSVAAAVLAMWAVYALGRWLWNRTGSLFAAALLAVCPTHALYSEAVRVDSLFLPLFVCACLQIARILEDPRRAQYDKAGLLTGLATGANYNGAILVPWLVLAHLLRWRDRRMDGPAGPGSLPRAAAFAVAGLVASSPFLLFDPVRAGKYLTFLAGISLADHPGMEGRGVLFYAADLAGGNPYLAAAIAVAGVAVVLTGTRRERFILSLAAAYFVLFSLLRTKFDRFILPATVLLLVVAAGLPSIAARRWSARPTASLIGTVAATAWLCAALAAWAPRAMPVPRNEMLARVDPILFEWIEQHVPPRSRILVEPGLLPLVDITNAPGRAAEALRRSLVTLRPNLDQEFIAATYVGEQSNYDLATLTARVDYAIVSPRNVEYIRSRCDTFAEVCAFYRELGARGRKVYRSPEGFELALVYELHPARDGGG